MKLITKGIITQSIKQGDTSSKSLDKIKVIAKFFGGAKTYYMAEYFPETHLGYGFVNLGDSQMAELGYFSIAELEKTQWPIIEKDKYFGKHTLREVMDTVKSGGHI